MYIEFVVAKRELRYTRVQNNHRSGSTNVCVLCAILCSTNLMQNVLLFLLSPMMSFPFFSLVEIYIHINVQIFCDLSSIQPNQTKPNQIEWKREWTKWMYGPCISSGLCLTLSISSHASSYLCLSRRRSLLIPFCLSLARFISMNEKCSSFRILTACLPALQFCYSIMPCLPLCTRAFMCVTARVVHLLLALFCRIDPLSLQQLSHISSALPFTHLNCMHIYIYIYGIAYIHILEHIFVHLWFYECINFSGELLQHVLLLWLASLSYWCDPIRLLASPFPSPVFYPFTGSLCLSTSLPCFLACLLSL